jgi:hypothetical protein
MGLDRTCQDKGWYSRHCQLQGLQFHCSAWGEFRGWAAAGFILSCDGRTGHASQLLQDGASPWLPAWRHASNTVCMCVAFELPVGQSKEWPLNCQQ